MKDPFGNYLCQKLAETCTPEELSKIVSVIVSDIIEISLNPHGTRAV